MVHIFTSEDEKEVKGRDGGCWERGLHQAGQRGLATRPRLPAQRSVPAPKDAPPPTELNRST